jgi:hypothetical protein
MKIEQLPDWVAIAISIVALFISLLERRANEKRQVREEFRQVLDNFLLPLQTIMARTHETFQYLSNGLRPSVELRVFEFSPSMMRDMFERLSDERKIFWQVEINQLQKDDQQAVALIDQYVSRTLVDPKFKKECEAFRRHATKWIERWNWVLRLEEKTPGLELNEPTGDPFPHTFDAAISAEVSRVKTAARLE